MKSNFRIYYIFCSLVCLPVILLSQQKSDRNSLERQKSETIKQIELTQGLLDQTRKSKNISVQQLNLLSKNISNRESLIKNYENDIISLNSDIDNNTLKIKEIESNLIKLKEEYSKIIKAVYRNLDKELYLEYIIGAQDINQSYQRLRQLSYLSSYRKNTFEELKNYSEDLHKENEELKLLLREKEKILYSKELELRKLTVERNQKEIGIKELKAHESKLIKEIRDKQNIQKRLEREINLLIENEILKSKEAKLSVLTPAERIISRDFARNIGGLPWPVNRGIITGQYGEHEHPVLKGIKIKSNGIDINTIEGEKALCIFDGEVTKIVAIMGANYTVIVKHGDFRTVYQNLINVSVKTGDSVKRGDSLGVIYTDSDNSTRLHFQIWQDKNNVNPVNWLSKNN